MAPYEILIDPAEGTVCAVKPPGRYFTPAEVADWIDKEIEPEGVDALHNAAAVRRCIADARFFNSLPIPPDPKDDNFTIVLNEIWNSVADWLVAHNTKNLRTPKRRSRADCLARAAAEMRDAARMRRDGYDSNFGRQDVRKKAIVRAELAEQDVYVLLGTSPGGDVDTKPATMDWEALVTPEQKADIENPGKVALPPRGDNAEAIPRSEIEAAVIVAEVDPVVIDDGVVP